MLNKFSIKTLICVLLFLVLSSCNYKFSVFGKKDIDYTEVHLESVDRNVCKKLQGRVILYAIFVDTKETKPWSE